MDKICKLVKRKIDNKCCCIVCDPNCEFPVDCNEIRKCGIEEQKNLPEPTFFQKVKNYTRAVTKHITTGQQTRTQEEIERIYNICEKCEYFKNSSCSICGCAISKNPNAFRNKIAMASENCPIGKWRFPEIIQHTNTFISTKKMIQHIQHSLKAIDNLKIDAVCGTARSGMIPATYLSLLLHKPLMCAGKETCYMLEGGERLSFDVDTFKFNNILVVDDSVISAKSINAAVESVKRIIKPENIYTMGLYCHTTALSLVDFPIVHLKLPHFFEWNILNCVYNKELAIDLDGLLCPDPPIDLDKDLNKFKEWILNVKPRHYRIQKSPVKLIVTARPELVKEETLLWLKKYDFKFEEIVFYPGTPEERDKNFVENVVEFKSKVLMNAFKNGIRFYFESDPTLGRNIFNKVSPFMRVFWPED